jgi:hypothetical protein
VPHSPKETTGSQSRKGEKKNKAHHKKLLKCLKLAEQEKAEAPKVEECFLAH